MPEYVFDNAGQQTPSRFSALDTMFNAGTFRHLEALGVAPGWRCLEVGGGSGSVARWLSERIGSTGHVVVTDIDTRHLETIAAPNVEIRNHNIVTDEIEADHFDLVHTRLVLVHLPERERVIERTVSALKSGGWALFEEFDSISMKPDASINPPETLLPTLEAMWRLMTDRGVDLGFGRRIAPILEANGLRNISGEGRVFVWRGASDGAELMRANFSQMHEAMVSADYVTEEQFKADVARLDDPKLMWPSSVLWAVQGQRP